ncbi:hypothetical protein C2845_PM04G16820 [Panicum miliaceum]|uniref:Uncharacterized protein n=1 Tax=Panicum miliaceum TaxID=4540 RepID=A0A3L6QP90_PANMI|nr:hypothetical protein C2845_PM04G16820 [Panicum miliaceum]
MAIKHAKDQIPGRLKMMAQQELCKVPTYHMMMASSWRNLGFDRVDFGSGRPARVTSSGKDMPPAPAVQGFLSSGRDGVSVLATLVTEEHADALLAELVKFVETLTPYCTMEQALCQILDNGRTTKFALLTLKQPDFSKCHATKSSTALRGI